MKKPTKHLPCTQKCFHTDTHISFRFSFSFRRHWWSAESQEWLATCQAGWVQELRLDIGLTIAMSPKTRWILAEMFLDWPSAYCNVPKQNIPQNKNHKISPWTIFRYAQASGWDHNITTHNCICSFYAIKAMTLPEGAAHFIWKEWPACHYVSIWQNKIQKFLFSFKTHVNVQ